MESHAERIRRERMNYLEEKAMEMKNYLELLEQVQSNVQWLKENVGYNMPRETKYGIIHHVMRAQKRLAEFGECTGIYNLDT